MIMQKSSFNALPAILGMTGLIALAAGMTSAIAAEPAPKVERQETVIVKVIKRDGQPVITGDDAEITSIISRCGGDKPTVDTSSETKDADGKVRKSHVIICNRHTGNGITNADLITRLEEARKHVTEVGELSADAKAKALASLDEEIARLRAAK
jgi:hypothetical protein